MTEFQIGDRVRVKLSEAHRYLQPWRDRFSSGRPGTVVLLKSANIHGVKVLFDHKRAKRLTDWEVVIRPSDLELVMEEATP